MWELAVCSLPPQPPPAFWDALTGSPRCSPGANRPSSRLISLLSSAAKGCLYGVSVCFFPDLSLETALVRVSRDLNLGMTSPLTVTSHRLPPSRLSSVPALPLASRMPHWSFLLGLLVAPPLSYFCVLGPQRAQGAFPPSLLSPG